MLDTICKYYIVIIGIITFSVVLSISFLWIAPPLFETSARIRIHKNQEEGIFITAVEILQGNVLAEEVLNSLGAERIFPKMQQEQRLRQFQSQLIVEPTEHTQVIHLSFHHREAALALNILEQILVNLNNTLKKLYGTHSGEGALLQQMQEAETALRLFTARHGGPRFQVRTEELTSQRHDLETQIRAEEKKIKDLENTVFALRQELQEDNQDVAELVQLKIYEKQLQQKYREEQETLQQVREQMQRLHKEPHDPRIENLIELQVAVNQQEIQRDKLKRILSQVKQQEQRLTAQSQVLEQLEAEFTLSQEQYEQALKEVEAFAVLERPLVPPPARHWMHVFGAILAGALASAVYVGFREFMAKKA